MQTFQANKDAVYESSGEVFVLEVVCTFHYILDQAYLSKTIKHHILDVTMLL